MVSQTGDDRDLNAVVRFYPEVRSMHLERAQTMRGEYLYLKRRDDYDESLESPDIPFRPISLTQLAIKLIRQPIVRVLEIPEPLWVKYAPHVCLILGALRVRMFLGRNRPVVVSYAIENVDRTSAVPHRLRFLGWAWRPGARMLVRWIISRIDRLAFGTESAREALHSSLWRSGRRRLEERSRLILALPTGCDCPGFPRSDYAQFLFVGGIERRKGADLLIDAWPDVLAREPNATLTVAGSGPLLDRLRDQASPLGSVKFIGSVGRKALHRLYRQSHVVVLASQPEGSWREQVGLPIVEGLAHQCRVVATSETGLADWLRDHGHHVLETPTRPPDLSAALVDAVHKAMAGSQQRLPAVDGRLAADRWLLEGAAGSLASQAATDG